MGIYWKELTSREQSRWMFLVSENNLEAFERSIEKLDDINKDLDKVSSFFSLDIFGKLIDYYRYRKDLKRRSDEFKNCIDGMEKKKRDHLVSSTFPQYQTWYSLEKKASRALLPHFYKR